MLLSKRLVLSFSATAITLVGGAGAAVACSAPACWPASFPVADGAVVPANVVMPYRVGSSSLLPAGAASDPKAFSLTDDQGKPVKLEATPDAASSTAFLIQPKETLTPGKTYQVRFPADCTATQYVQRTLQAGPEVSLPSEVGTVVASGHRIGTLSVPTSSGSCVTPIKAALAKVTITPSPALRAYWPVAEVTATANGVGVPVATRQFLPNGSLNLEVYAGCNVNDPGASLGLPPGVHALQVHVKVAGAPALPPVTTSIELRCTEALADAGAIDSGTGVDSGSVIAPAPDAGTNDSAPVITADGGTDNKRDANGGCSAGPGTPGSGGAMIALFALLIGYARRRRLYQTITK